MINLQTVTTRLHEAGWSNEQILNSIDWTCVEYAPEGVQTRSFHLGQYAGDLVLNFPMLLFIISMLGIGAYADHMAFKAAGAFWLSLYFFHLPRYVHAQNEHFRDDCNTMRPIKYIIITGLFLLLSLTPIFAALNLPVDIMIVFLFATPDLILLVLMWIVMPMVIERYTTGWFTHGAKPDDPILDEDGNERIFRW